MSGWATFLIVNLIHAGVAGDVLAESWDAGVVVDIPDVVVLLHHAEVANNCDLRPGIDNLDEIGRKGGLATFLDVTVVHANIALDTLANKLDAGAVFNILGVVGLLRHAEVAVDCHFQPLRVHCIRF